MEELAADWLLTSHTVTQEDYAALVDIPAAWEDRAKLPTMGFESIAELVAEDYHLSPKALARLNPNATLPNPPVGTVLIVPDTKNVALEPAARLEIDLNRFALSAYDATGRQIAHFPVSIARNRSKRPEGALSIETIVPDPNYLYDPANYDNPPGERKQVIPPGPNNPVGVVWFGLNLPGYGLHGSPHPETIGRAESKGCFRLNNWNALKLLQMIRPHTPLSVH